MGKGKLLFKGDKPKKKKSKSKHSRNETEIEAATPAATAAAPTTTTTAINGPSASISKLTTATTSSSSSTTTTPTIRKGTGTITTSGTVVTGHDTKFEKELANGDALLCIVNGQEELRVITMRLSNISLNLSSPFSCSLSTPTSFQYIRQPRDIQKERKEAKKKELATKQEREQHAYDLYKSEQTLVYREKTETGSYRIKKETLAAKNKNNTDGVSRGQLLELRAKKTSDKYC